MASTRRHDEAAVAAVRAMYNAVISKALEDPDVRRDAITVRFFDDLPEHLQFSVVRGLSNLIPVIVRVATTPTPKET